MSHSGNRARHTSANRRAVHATLSEELRRHEPAVVWSFDRLRKHECVRMRVDGQGERFMPFGVGLSDRRTLKSLLCRLRRTLRELGVDA